MIGTTNSVTPTSKFSPGTRHQGVLANVLHSISHYVSLWFDKYELRDGVLDHEFQYCGDNNFPKIKNLNIFLDYPTVEVTDPDYGSDPSMLVANPALVIMIISAQVRNVAAGMCRMSVTVRFDLKLPSFGQVTTNMDTMLVGSESISRYAPLYMQFADNLLSAVMQFPYFEFDESINPQPPKKCKGIITSSQPLQLVAGTTACTVQAVYEFNVIPVRTNTATFNTLDIQINDIIMYKYMS